MRNDKWLRLLAAYVVTVVVFVAAKVVFFACCGSGHGVSASDVWPVTVHGLTLDLSTALYFVAAPLVFTMFEVWTRLPQWLWKVYFAFIAAMFAVAFVADTSLYPFWGFKLDASCLQYLEQPEGITSSVSVGYLLLRAVATVVTAYIIYKVYVVCCLRPPTRALAESPTRRRPSGTGRRLAATAGYVLLVPLMVVGIRGGVSESTTNIGQVYYSQNQFLNHAAVNPVFSFLYSLSHQTGDMAEYQFMSYDECLRLTEGVYTTESVLTDTLLTTRRPDIVIILLESCGEQFAEAMPRLQQLKGEGVYFSHCYGNSWRTDRGTVCALSGYPSFPSLSVMKMPEKTRSLPGIAKTLRAHAYATRYIYGGDINFTNMRSYLIGTGWEQLTSMDDYSVAERQTAKWGVRDDITFRTVEEMVEGAAKGAAVDAAGDAAKPRLTEKRSLLVGYSTLSSHEPWDVPGDRRHDDEVLNAFGYLDECLWDFIEHMKASPAWDNLLIVLTADHGINHGRIDTSTPREKSHIPMLWLGGAIREPRTVSTICNQSDLAATLLGQLGLAHDDFTFSRDVLSQTYRHPVAVHNYYNAQWATDSTGHCLYDFDMKRYIVSEGDSCDRLLRVSKAMLQLTTEDLKER